MKYNIIIDGCSINKMIRENYNTLKKYFEIFLFVVGMQYVILKYKIFAKNEENTKKRIF